jgi:hypothetical protein
MRTSGNGSESLMMVIPLLILSAVVVYLVNGDRAFLDMLEGSVRGLIASAASNLSALFR